MIKEKNEKTIFRFILYLAFFSMANKKPAVNFPTAGYTICSL